MKAFARSLIALLFDAAFAALILLSLAAFQYLMTLVPVSASLKGSFLSVHEWSTLAILAIFVVKSVLRLLISTSEQVDELTRSLTHSTEEHGGAKGQKNAT